MSDELIESAPLFFVGLLVVLVLMMAFVFFSTFKLGAVANPQGITVTTPREDQAAKVTIEDCVKQDLGQITRYDFKIKIIGLGLFSQDKYENLLPVFIFKSSAIPAEKIGEDAIDPAKGISIPDSQKKDPLESIYSFESYEAISVDTFSPSETVLITFLATGESSSVVAEECKTNALKAFENYRSNPQEFKLLHNLQEFQRICQPLIKGTVSVKATNTCITPESVRLNIVDLSVISEPTGENTKIIFTVTAVTPITSDKHVKIYISCNSDETKNLYLPKGDAYIEQKDLITNKYAVNMQCGNDDIQVQVIKNCIDKDATPGCDSAPNPDDILASETRLPPVA